VACAAKVYSFIKETEKKNSISEAKVRGRSGNASFRTSVSFEKAEAILRILYALSICLIVECRAQQQQDNV